MTCEERWSAVGLCSRKRGGDRTGGSWVARGSVPRWGGEEQLRLPVPSHQVPRLRSLRSGSALRNPGHDAHGEREGEFYPVLCYSAATTKLMWSRKEWRTPPCEEPAWNCWVCAGKNVQWRLVSHGISTSQQTSMGQGVVKTSIACMHVPILGGCKVTWGSLFLVD